MINAGDDLFNFPGLVYTKTPEQSKRINITPGPKVIIAGSGMCHVGRILHHLKHYLPDPNNQLLFITYLAAGLDPEKCIFFIQSQVKEHSELAWL